MTTQIRFHKLVALFNARRRQHSDAPPRFVSPVLHAANNQRLDARKPALSGTEILGIDLAQPDLSDFEMPGIDWAGLRAMIKTLWQVASLIGGLALVVALGVGMPVMMAVFLLDASQGSIACDNCFHIGGNQYNAMGFFAAALLAGVALVVLGATLYALTVIRKRRERRHLFG